MREISKSRPLKRGRPSEKLTLKMPKTNSQKRTKKQLKFTRPTRRLRTVETTTTGRRTRMKRVGRRRTKIHLNSQSSKRKNSWRSGTKRTPTQKS